MIIRSILIAVLMLMIPGSVVYAAGYQKVALAIRPWEKIGKYYYWTTEDENSDAYLMCGKTKNDGKALVMLKSYQGADFHLGSDMHSILTNGTSIYYIRTVNQQDILGKISTSGTNNTELETLHYHENLHGSAYLEHIYGNSVFYSVYDPGTYKTHLYVYNLKTGQKKKVWDQTEFLGSGRYLYSAVIKKNKLKVTVFDCKKLKVTKKYSVTMKKHEYMTVSETLATKKYVYFHISVYDDDPMDLIYRMPVKGSSKPECVATIQYDGIGSVYKVTDKTIYFRNGSGKKFQYSFATGKIKKIK